VDGQAVQKILDTQMDLVKTDQKPVASALRDAAAQINAEIRRTVAQDPSLRRLYRERLAVSAIRPVRPAVRQIVRPAVETAPATRRSTRRRGAGGSAHVAYR
jgi:hypothetical protein